ncbi:competence type IV pilus minor pilin ComGD [Jeotgalibacillus sp. R-1-5s-1]|uniref:competence type IV pilus minor pilin ComGD n=1 Tax=Jeotgalibacillus sp. R-1-5s-1 TaxID=2555897 RepID=UPI00106C889F|nr:competence type IV pilus minor pilin ComGD [Jeotgalibacillus sp. R-1-5s-1]TFD92276.1 prepilin-type N-terminal cleavage/methylation domain-containing protein [Jeotgalibacillus sp. R-1-5s-1]
METRHKESGFTLIEVMIVLLVLSIFIVIASSVSVTADRNLAESFENQLSQDLHYAQLKAITDKTYIQFQLLPAESRYVIRMGTGVSGKILLERRIPEQVEFNSNSSLQSFRYTPVGNTNTFGSMRFFVNGDHLAFHFYLARGRFTIEK